ncbi:unnamed protein product [Urochloa humidicola]
MASSLLSSPAKPCYPTTKTLSSRAAAPRFAHGLSAAAAVKASPSLRRLRALAGTIRASQQQPLPRRRPEYVPNRIDDPNYVRIFDTTLRDGEQSPGATMTSAEKLVIARQLARLGVDIIEAGFPASSPDDLDAVRSIAIEVGNTPVGEEGHVPVICGLSRCNNKDIDAAWEAVRHARRPRIHTFIATSEIHMQHKLRKTPEQVVAIAKEMVAYARSLGCPDVEFSPEDAGSGSHAVRSKLAELGYEISDKEFVDFFKRYKEVAEKKKRVTDEDIEALLSDEIFQPKVIWSLGHVQATCGTLGLSVATVKLIAPDGEEKVECSMGTGPVDAAYKAVDKIIQIPTVLREYSMSSVTEGIDAIATTRVVITGDVSNNSKHALTGQSFNRSFSGSGASMDVVVSSVRAYLSALNKMCSFAGIAKASSEVHERASVQSKE